MYISLYIEANLDKFYCNSLEPIVSREEPLHGVT